MKRRSYNDWRGVVTKRINRAGTERKREEKAGTCPPPPRGREKIGKKHVGEVHTVSPIVASTGQVSVNFVVVLGDIFFVCKASGVVVLRWHECCRG